MNALFYLWKRRTINKIKKSLKKPVTYIYLLFIGFYVFSLMNSVNIIFSNPDMNTFVLLLVAAAIFMIPLNLVTYAKRKGLMFRNSDVHFLFPSPIMPKTVITFAFLQTLFARAIFCIVFVVVGILGFHIPIWRMLLYGVFSIGFQFTLEGSLAVILYASEKLTEKSRSVIKWLCYSIYAALVLIAFVGYLKYGLAAETTNFFFHGDPIQFIPVFGWYVAVVHLLLVKPTVVNVIGTVCYLVFFVVIFTLAKRMKCVGEYYEDALKFADDYEEAMQKQKKGNTVMQMGKKAKYGTAQVAWKGTGAKALFYRQLLEYKKTKFFIFDLNMVILFLASVTVGVLAYFESSDPEFMSFAPYILPIVGACLTFIMTAINGKWTTELNSPYTYLIPDSAFNKLMSVTMIPNIKNLIAGLLLAIPASFTLKTSPIVVLLTAISYMLVAGCKIYGHAVAEVVIGDAIGLFGRQMFEMMVLSFCILFGVGGAFLGLYVSGITLAYLLMDILMLLYTSIFVVIATLNFYHQEA